MGGQKATNTGREKIISNDSNVSEMILRIKRSITASKSTNNSYEVSSEEVKKYIQQLNNSKDSKDSMSINEDSVFPVLIKITAELF